MTHFESIGPIAAKQLVGAYPIYASGMWWSDRGRDKRLAGEMSGHLAF